MATQTFTSGSGTWTVPSGNECTKIEVWGPGGGGGGGDGSPSEAAGGAGGGGYCSYTPGTPIAAGTNISYAVGTVGTGRASHDDLDGGNGTASTVSTYSLTANGGNGGKSVSNGSTGGTGGTASGGTVNTTGSSGLSSSGATGGAGGAGANGGAGGAGGGSSSPNGADGTAPGGGGGGGGRHTSSGAGGAGQIVFTYSSVSSSFNLCGVTSILFGSNGSGTASGGTLMGRDVKKGSTSQPTILFAYDSTTGAPKTGLTYTSSGLALWYRRLGGAKTSITPANLAALTTAWAEGGFKEIGDGYYRLDVPDAAFATGANEVLIGGAVTGATIVGNSHALVDVDPQDAVRFGLTALPNAVAGASGGIPIEGQTVLANMTTIKGTALGSESAGAGALAAAFTKQYNVSSGGVFTNASVNQSGDAYAQTNDGTIGLSALKTILDALTAINNKVDGMLQSDGGGGYQYTATALAEAPAGGGGGGPSAGDIAAAVVDQTLSGHNTAGTVGGALDAANSLAGSYVAPDNAGISSAASAATSAASAAASAASDAADAATNSASAASAASAAASAATTAASAASAAAAVTDKLDTALEDDGSSGYQFTALALENAPGGLSPEQGTKLDEVHAAATEALEELTGDPGATPTPRQALARQYMKERNKREVTSTTDTLYNDAGTAISSQTLNDDGTKLVRGKAT